MDLTWSSSPSPPQQVAQEQEAPARAIPARPIPQLGKIFHCAICYDDHDRGDAFVVSQCRHLMCREAARSVALAAIKACQAPVLCPICAAKLDPPCALCQGRLSALKAAAAVAAAAEAAGGDGGSGGNRGEGAGGGGGDGGGDGPVEWCCSLDADLWLLLTEEEEAEYLARSVRAAAQRCADLVPCPAAGCEGLAVAGHGTRLVCNVCKHEWCSKCRVAWHTGVTCEERSAGELAADQGFAEYEKANKVVRCPTCGHGIEKVAGCNRVTCSVCRTNVCWLCGTKLSAHNPYQHFQQAGPCSNGIYDWPPRGVGAPDLDAVPAMHMRMRNPGELREAAERMARDVDALHERLRIPVDTDKDALHERLHIPVDVWGRGVPPFPGADGEAGPAAARGAAPARKPLPARVQARLERMAAAREAVRKRMRALPAHNAAAALPGGP
ncbi:hypothetical protein WJX81_008504 [Elliptochloris bilobata]|uniref:RING-type domain-containing protein n=1 Tax=Elliptochloris bilobata TaxID=381761 RepID=A0AAW1SK03_9CHLO